MNLKRILITAVLVCAAIAQPLQARSLLDRIHTPQGHVSDYAGVFTPAQKAQLEGFLRSAKQQTSAEIAVVVIPSLEDESLDDFTNVLFERWRVGRADKNNGIMILTAINDRKIRIEVGYGLEGILPDAKVGRIVDEHIIPSFRAGRVAEGLSSGAAAIAGIIAKDAGVTLTGGNALIHQPRERKQSVGSLIFTIIMLLILIPFAIKHPYLAMYLLASSMRGGGYSGGGFGGGFGGFGGGLSGGGGASRSW
jgi:uncharacterized protein